MSSRAIVIGLCGLMLLTGCVQHREMRFEIVDAETNAPVSGVAVRQTSFKTAMFFSNGRTVELAPSDAGGYVKAKPLALRDHFIQQFSFSKEGYCEAGAVYRWRDNLFAVTHRPREDLGNVKHAEEVDASTGTAHIRLHRCTH